MHPQHTFSNEEQYHDRAEGAVVGSQDLPLPRLSDLHLFGKIRREDTIREGWHNTAKENRDN